MILYEFEGKQLLKSVGVSVPQSQLITKDQIDSLDRSTLSRMTIKPPLVLKAQVLSGNRAKAGGIITLKPGDNLEESLKLIFEITINQESVEKILVEELVEFSEQYYLSLTYDTDTRGILLTVSDQGGTGIENRSVQKYQIDILNPIFPHIAIPADLGDKLIQLFLQQDMLLLEINPLVKVTRSQMSHPVLDMGSIDIDSRLRGNDRVEWIALDAKIKLDDDAKFRHDPSADSGQGWQFSPRLAPGHNPTESEIAAKQIDQDDYRGTAGSAYFDLDGDIAILSSGGGVSLTAMDALIKAGGRPANFTEYSGNPPREKVIKLTKIVLFKPNIHGLWIVGTVAANFTDIYETLMGIIDGLRQAQAELNTQFNFPIIIRRGGPRGDEAFTALKELKDFKLILQGEEVSITQSAKVMVEESQKYAVTS